MKTIKHLFTLLLLLCATEATAHDFVAGGIYYNITDATNKTVEVTSGANKYTGSVVIPESVTYKATTYSVASIGYQAFDWCTALTGIEIPNSVTSIGDWAFKDCYGLTSITIPNSVTEIRNRALDCCRALTSITYNGTMEEWNTIQKASHGAGWNYDVPTKVAHCTDGDAAAPYTGEK